jgi:hypothetical protein
MTEKNMSDDRRCEEQQLLTVRFIPYLHTVTGGKGERHSKCK